jgi:hypothetical protein
MDDKKTIINIVNRDYPPYSGITGESAAELVQFLLHKGFSVNVIHVDAPFWGKNNISPPGNIFKVKTLFNGNNKILRLIANLIAGYRLIQKSKNVPCHLTIVMTDPSLLNMWASILLKNKKWMLWSMDLYPEAFVAGKLIRVNHPLYKKILQLTLENPPDRIISLGPQQTAFLQKRYNDRIPHFFSLPCGIYDNRPYANSEKPLWADDPSKIYLGYCGNLGSSHSLELLQSIASHFNTEKFVLVLSVYGIHANKIKQFVQGRKGVKLVPSVRRDQLQFIDVHLASLLPQWTHIAVPSKTVSSVCAGSAFLFYGTTGSDNWTLLKDAGWIIPYGENVETGVIDFFQQFDEQLLIQKKIAAHQIAEKLVSGKMKTFEDIAAYAQNSL